MGPLLVVFSQLVVSDLAHLRDGFEDVGFENLIPRSPQSNGMAEAFVKTCSSRRVVSGICALGYFC
jgi:hypothetical protein